MKELYISPELEILCFMPMEGIATDYDLTLAGQDLDNGLSTGETKKDDFFTPVVPPVGGGDGNLS